MISCSNQQTPSSNSKISQAHRTNRSRLPREPARVAKSYQPCFLPHYFRRPDNVETSHPAPYFFFVIVSTLSSSTRTYPSMRWTAAWSAYMTHTYQPHSQLPQILTSHRAAPHLRPKQANGSSTDKRDINRGKRNIHKYPPSAARSRRGTHQGRSSTCPRPWTRRRAGSRRAYTAQHDALASATRYPIPLYPSSSSSSKLFVGYIWLPSRARRAWGG